LNRADLLQKKGKYNPPQGASKILGLESVGVIVDPTSLKPIDNKIYGALLPGGGYADYVVVDRSHLVEIPDSFTLEQAAAVPEAWLTAFLILELA
jgi:tumor protein p53-inducible protein 3